MTTATIIEQIIPLNFLSRGMTGLPENCFQQFYVLYLDGIETIGCDTIENVRHFAKAAYDLDVSGVAISETVFTGFRRR